MALTDCPLPSATRCSLADTGDLSLDRRSQARVEPQSRGLPPACRVALVNPEVTRAGGITRQDSRLGRHSERTRHYVQVSLHASQTALDDLLRRTHRQDVGRAPTSAGPEGRGGSEAGLLGSGPDSVAYGLRKLRLHSLCLVLLTCELRAFLITLLRTKCDDTSEELRTPRTGKRQLFNECQLLLLLLSNIWGKKRETYHIRPVYSISTYLSEVTDLLS